jgi:hypothetical protein
MTLTFLGAAVFVCHDDDADRFVDRSKARDTGIGECVHCKGCSTLDAAFLAIIDRCFKSLAYESHARRARFDDKVRAQDMCALCR